MEVDLKSLIAKLDRTCHRALEAAAGLCQSRTNYEIELEHWLFKINEDSDNDLAPIFKHFGVNPDTVNAALTRAMDRLKTGNSRAPALSPNLVAVLRDALVLSTVEFGWQKIRSGVVLLAALGESRNAIPLLNSVPDLEKIKPDQLKANLPKLVAESAEEAEMGATAPTGSVASGKAGLTKTPALDQFTINLTANAREGKIDPVLGRDPEIRQIIDILTRRRQNNPILTGEAGVGKTAVVEGFALRIAANDVPPPLQNVELRTLDLGLLQAGAGVKGEFENRLKSVIEEVKSSPKPIILFIDEAHQLIGAGGSAGQGDAANLLKPALARGELRTIAATTWAEYKKYFEKDAALARRFQVVKVEEPSEETAISMMRGLTETLSAHHGVPILAEAVEASVRLSARYISGRQLPDKSVSLLDTACARVAIGQTAIPPAIEDSKRRIMLLETEKRVLTAEQATGSDHSERLAQIDAELDQTQTKLAGLEERWKQERELVQQINSIRKQLQDAATGNGKSEPLTEEQTKQLRQQIVDLTAQLSSIQGETPLMQPFVDAQTVAEVVSAWTGIPAGRMMADEIQTVLKLKDLLCERVVGQDHAQEVIAKRIQTSRANMDDPQKPIGVFLLVGPSGVGKTETAISLAELLYGGEKNMITINMSEYQEAHTVSSLKGSPPGYVGYGEGGVLTEAVRRKPYSVVLLDEVEKAHPDVMELFFQVFDKGVLEDGEGRVIDFKNTIILLTSNVATDTIMSLCADPETTPDSDTLVQAIRPELEKVFKPALLGRMFISAFYPLKDDVLRKIVKLKLNKIVRRVQENNGARLTYDEGLLDEVVSRCKEVQSGARNIDNILTNTLLPEISREFLARMAEGQIVRSINVGVGESGEFVYTFA